MTVQQQPVQPVQQAPREFVAEPPISVIVTPRLGADEAGRLLTCMNKVRSGEVVYLVRLTNRRVSKGPPRLPDQDYQADPALQPHAHEGWLVEARINKKGVPYIRLHDEARKPVGAEREFGFTCISMEGIESFKVLAERPGPLAVPAPQPAVAQPLAAQTALALQAQGLALMGQAMIQMAQAITGQPPVPPPQP